ncbi:MAG: BMC domain-containing protein, partial [Ruthenibacterium sp.]
MSRALGMIEFKTVSSGITVADKMVKAANVEM